VRGHSSPSGVRLDSYTAAGDGHRILEWPRFYELGSTGKGSSTGYGLIDGEGVDDVHCK
jgi:hypothetical protein